MMNLARRIWRFYAEGFRGMTPVGRRLWVIIIVKVVIIFAVIRALLMPDTLSRQGGDTDAARAALVRSHLAAPAPASTDSLDGGARSNVP